MWKSHLNTLISQFESFRLFTLWLPPNYDNIIFCAQVVNVHPEASKTGKTVSRKFKVCLQKPPPQVVRNIYIFTLSVKIICI